MSTEQNAETKLGEAGPSREAKDAAFQIFPSDLPEGLSTTETNFSNRMDNEAAILAQHRAAQIIDETFAALRSTVSSLEQENERLKGRADEKLYGEIQRAIGFVPTGFIRNDAWENGVKRLAEHRALLVHEIGIAGEHYSSLNASYQQLSDFHAALLAQVEELKKAMEWIIGTLSTASISVTEAGIKKGISLAVDTARSSLAPKKQP